MASTAVWSEFTGSIRPAPGLSVATTCLPPSNGRLPLAQLLDDLVIHLAERRPSADRLSRVGPVGVLDLEEHVDRVNGEPPQEHVVCVRAGLKMPGKRPRVRHQIRRHERRFTEGVEDVGDKSGVKHFLIDDGAYRARGFAGFGSRPLQGRFDRPERIEIRRYDGELHGQRELEVRHRIVGDS